MGILITITGAASVIMYFGQAVIAQLGEPDQSLLFWYLPFLFQGIVGVGAGLGLGLLGWVGLRSKPQGPHTEAQSKAKEIEIVS